MMSGMIWLSEWPVFQPWRVKPRAEVGGIGEKLFAAVGFGLDDVECGDGGGAGGGGLRGGEDIRAGAVGEPIDERLRAADETAAGAEGFAERADADVVEPEC